LLGHQVSFIRPLIRIVLEEENVRIVRNNGLGQEPLNFEILITTLHGP
jgi:hypothetical protein